MQFSITFKFNLTCNRDIFITIVYLFFSEIDLDDVIINYSRSSIFPGQKEHYLQIFFSEKPDGNQLDVGLGFPWHDKESIIIREYDLFSENGTTKPLLFFF